MAEYIEREALLNEAKKRAKAFSCALIYEAIKEAPAADVVEVIRCKDCKHWNDENIELHRSSNEDETSAEFAECRFFSTMRLCYMMRFDDFCSQGERRGNEAERAESNTKNNDVN